MKLFKVFFDGTTAVAAEPVPEPRPAELINIVEINGKRLLEWLIVSAHDENDAMSEAEHIAIQYKDSLGL